MPKKPPSYTELEELLRRERPSPEALWLLLERFVREHLLRGSYTRTNLVPDAPRDKEGKLVTPLPSEQIRDTQPPIFRICKKMNPDHPFNAVQVNKFTSHRQCQLHRDKRNVGDSRLAIMGDCQGGALRLEDGRKFDQKYKWYTYNGAEVAHEVEPFVGERLSIVLYDDSVLSQAYVLKGRHPVPLSPACHDSWRCAVVSETDAQHPLVTTPETLAEIQQREKELQAASEKAKIEWKRRAAQKEWYSVKSDMDVYRHSGETVKEDPRRTPEYQQQVVDGLGLTTEAKPHLSQQDIEAIIEMVKRKAAAFWIEGTPRTTVRYFQHDTIPTGPPCRLPPHNLKGEQAEWVDQKLDEEVQLSLIHI